MASKFAATLALALYASICMAAYPERPVRLVVPAAPGGAVDAVGRITGQKISELIGQNVVIDNRTGANQIIGTEIVARAAPDGYTLLITAGAFTINPSLYRKLPYDALRDFAPIVHIANSGGLVIVVHPSFPAKSLGELIEIARAGPGKVIYGSAGFGNLTHLGGEMFQALAGVRLTHVPYKGAGPAINDLLGGQIPLMFGPAAAVIPLVKAGRLRPLAFTGSKRSEALPDLPTAEEAGVRGYVASGWFGVYAPRGTPGAVVRRLNAAVNRMLKMPVTLERFAALNLEPVGGSPEDFARFLREDIRKYAKIISAVGIQPQ
ncbi:MAG TPA: tripartite tricarboxylate transporter substrate binding protein [Burkholderiales bacterium]|nr:tripartite tricarboxylate transporter substrate binding protein [Burkholderiales bacterium]